MLYITPAAITREKSAVKTKGIMLTVNAIEYTCRYESSLNIYGNNCLCPSLKLKNAVVLS
jgi:hypothetical protein